MDVNFLGQPWQDGTNLDDFLAEATGRPGPNRLRIAAAWGKRSGFRRVRPYMDTWRAAGGTVELVLGLSEGGATRQGLEEALDAADSVYLFHDVSGRTFHPKVYLAESAHQNDLFVGSHNLTAGGVFFNYEAAITVSVATADLAQAVVMMQAHTWFERLLADGDCCRAITAATLPGLVSNPAYRIGDEDHRRKAAPDESDAPEEVDAVTPSADEAGASFFGRSQSAKKKNRHVPPPADGSSSPSGRGRGAPTPLHPLAPAAYPALPDPSRTATPVLRWSKQMKRTDAQQPPGANTQPTYNLRLAQARHPIDIRTYFRSDFFNLTQWNTDPADPDLQYTHVDMQVSVYGVDQGSFRFRIDHDLNRVAGQGNVPTVLKWGPLSDHMLNVNHVEDWVLLEKFDDDTYRLSIESADPGTTP